jgi:hypothetical protein
MPRPPCAVQSASIGVGDDTFAADLHGLLTELGLARPRCQRNPSS